jgi:hypothetical protein
MRRRDEGAVAVEFALLLPLLVVMLLAILDYGIWYSDSIALRSASREGIRLAAVNDYPAACSGTPAQKARCAVVTEGSFIGGTPAAHVVVREGSWTEGHQLVICTAIKETGLTHLVPLPGDEVLRSKASIRLESTQIGSTEVVNEGDPSGNLWNWC